MNPTISTLAPDAWRRAMAATTSLSERWDHRIEVEVTTLDRLIEEFGSPHFCKIDVELPRWAESAGSTRMDRQAR